VLPTVTPHLVANNGLTALRAAIADPERYVVEPKVGWDLWVSRGLWITTFTRQDRHFDRLVPDSAIK
jgi:hypothetical protein